MNKKTFLLIAFCIFQVLNISVYAYNLKQITDKGNFSNRSVISMYQDQRGLMWIGTNNGLNNYNGREISAFHLSDSSNVINGNQIDKITEMSDNVIWIQTYYGLNRIDRKANSIQSFEMFNRVAFSQKDSKDNFFIIQGNSSIYYYLKDKNQFEEIYMSNLIANEIVNFFIDNKDRMWIFKSNGVSFCYTIQTNESGIVRLELQKEYKQTDGLLYSFTDKNRVLLIDTDYNLYEFDTENRKSLLINNLKDQLSNKGEISSILKFHNDYFFGFRKEGLFLLKDNNGEVLFEKIPINSGILSLLKDIHQDMIWIGTDGQGLYTYSIDRHSINSTLLNDFTLKVRQPIKALFLDDKNTLWIGSNGDGILKIYDYELNKNLIDCKMENINNANSALSGNSVYSFSKSKRNILWIGNENGLNYYSNHDKTIKKVALSDDNTDIKYIHDVYEQDSLLWIASAGMGIIKAQIDWHGDTPSLKIIKRFTIKKGDIVSNSFFSIYPENDNTIWVTNKGEGIFKINTATSEVEIIRFEGNILNEINCIINNRPHNYLIGTNSGLIRYTSDSYTVLNEENGFPNNRIHSILQESDFDFWLSSNNGLIFYNSQRGSLRTYDQLGGLSVIEFSTGASFKDENSGTLFFGGVNGFVTITQNYYDEANDYMPPINLDKLSIFGQDYNIHEFLSEKEKIPVLSLNHNQNFFSISFSAIDHLNGNNYTYFYKIDGSSRQWVDNGNSNVISFVDFKPGEYKLQVKYYNNILGKESYIYTIKVKILPPWYQSKLSYSVYSLLAVLCVLLLIRWFVIRNRQRKAALLAKLEQQHKEDIYESKLQFFTNIAHEFCTPLTLISGPCNRILNHKNIDSSITKYAQIIEQNAERLNSLIQDLIEFKRIETGYKEAQIEKLQLSEIVNKITNSFNYIAESQNTHFEKDVSPSIIWNSDESFIITIITNIISNAFKYTTHNGKVKVKARLIEGHLYLVISNTGKGIKAENISKIFDRYNILHDFEYQDNSKSWSRNGLGLAISYGMVNLLKGTIDIESTPGEWTHFKITLPYLEETNQKKIIKYDTLKTEGIKNDSNVIATLPKYKSDDESKPTILIIDDELEILWLICDIFADDFNVIPVNNSDEALLKLNDIHPDIILCDVMMQGIDGIALTKELKLNEKTAHIPLILISAKQEVEEQIKGINAGADIYITKPFNIDYLKSSVNKLIERKETLKDYFASPLSAFELTNGKMTHKEHKKLIKEIFNIINKNIQDKDLSADFIATKMNISTRSLYRKIGEIGDVSISDMIRDCKLYIAHYLLIKSILTVDEIVFKSGFTNRVSFFKAFSKKYGCTPNEYRKQNSKPS
ncbi:hybrid sensor histidine kinase/response regulator transcription factor [Dysgonomonas sp. ZJ709]|uniref:hybrid sensor histidine kinase/response regulator transcription factor n=1 Tax=Dysgonomonas sp. ZJ709 TaxID=2709797 RepID=UPI0013EC296B|nr:hybrid sensor histidine kinase/response regulator transcription factor [Dysgonomonas sp. ZJ709]